MSKSKDRLIKLYNQTIKDKDLLNNKYLPILSGLIEVICYSNDNNEQEIEKKF